MYVYGAAWGLHRLSKKPKAEKKLAITVFSFPPDKGNVGTAAYLNVFGSIYRVLQDLKKEGYDVGEIPETDQGLMQSVWGSNPCSKSRPCKYFFSFSFFFPSFHELHPPASSSGYTPTKMEGSTRHISEI